MTEEEPQLELDDSVAVHIPQEYNRPSVAMQLGGKYELSFDYRFSGFRSKWHTGKSYGSDIDCQELYELLCGSFNNGVSFIDTYFEEVFPISAVKADADLLLNNLTASIKSEYIKNVKPSEGYHDMLRDRYYESIDDVEDFKESLDVWFNTYLEANDFEDNLVYTKSGKLDWRYRRNREYMYAERMLNELYSDTWLAEGNLSVPYARRGKRGNYAQFYEYMLPYIQESVNTYNASREQYLQDFEGYSIVKSSFDSFKKTELETSALSLAEDIKEDIIMSLAIGLIPLQRTISPATIKRREYADIFGDNLFYATGQLINALQLVITIKEKK